MPMQFRLFGPVEAEVNGKRVELGHARQRCVLAVLLVNANRVVPVDVILDRVWADKVPNRARVTLSGYVSRLRRLLTSAGEVSLVRQSDGYRLAVDPMAVDLHRFRGLVTRARAATARDEGMALLTEALGLWQGQAFAALDTPWLNDVREELAAERLAAELDRNDLALDQGGHAAMLTELSTSAAAHPWDERLAGQLMLALYRCGRQADALHHYEGLRSHLAHELGADPCPPLQQLHQRILTADPTLTSTPAEDTPVPRQLPTPPGSFTGRSHELAHMNTLLHTATSTVVISAVAGTAGVGKTALALHWAHQVASEFPDGQLYVNLRGFDPGGSRLSPGEAVRGFLDALGVSPHRIPSGADAQTALYRSLLADKQMLVVLDNARDAEQVQPLLPGTPGSLVLVTSRNQLTSLIVNQGAHPFTLDLLTAAEARNLLANRIGHDRVAAEPDAVNDIITRCAQLPLALTIVAARAATHPHFPLHTLASELCESQRRLDALADPDPRTDVRAVFSWSYDTLNPDTARLFRLLGLHLGPDFTAPTAASLTAIPLTRIRPLLTELTRAHLITEHVPGRYVFHDLLRIYAAEKSETHDTVAERREAAHRLLDHYLHTAHTATELTDPYQGDQLCLSPAQAGVVAEDFPDQDQATAWFTAEYPALLAAIDYAAQHRGFETYAWSLAWTLGEYRYRRGYGPELAAVFHTALCAAERVADERGQAHAHRSLGIAHQMYGHYDQAGCHFRRALDLFGELGDHSNQAAVHCNIGLVAEKLGRAQDALDHARQALNLRRAVRDRVGQARALNSVGWHHVVLGDHHQALTCLEQALSLIRDTDDRLGQAAIWDSLGYAHHHLTHYQQAIECYHHSLHLDRELGNRYFEATTLTHLGDTHHATKRVDQARDTWRRAFTIFCELDHPDAEETRTKLTNYGV